MTQRVRTLYQLLVNKNKLLRTVFAAPVVASLAVLNNCALLLLIIFYLRYQDKLRKSNEPLIKITIHGIVGSTRFGGARGRRRSQAVAGT